MTPNAGGDYVGLLTGKLSDAQIQTWFEALGFRHWQTAHKRVLGLVGTHAQHALVWLPQLFNGLNQAPNPDQTLINLERLVQNASERATLLARFAQQPRTVETLTLLFSGSQFLTEILLRHPHYVDRLLSDKNHLVETKSRTHMVAEAQSRIRAATQGKPGAHPVRGLDALRRWQRWEFLRIGTCDLLGRLDLSAVTQQLSFLADSLVYACLDWAAAGAVEGFCVLALGKLGGQELNYSSDIDLLFVARENANQYEALGRRLIDALTRITPEGFLYRVDMRLRPWGRSGPLVSSLDAYVKYLEQHARLWEKQALLKARVVVGDRHLGAKVLQRIRPLIVGVSNEVARAEVHALKQRTEAHLRHRGRGWGEVKLGEGSIRDIEFIIQFLQLVHGKTHPSILTSNSTEALVRLQEAGLLDARATRVLEEGYTFLRTLEHHLQIMHHRQTHTLPQDPDQLDQLARRLGFAQAQGPGQFLERYREHSEAIRSLYLAHFEVPVAAPVQQPAPAAQLLNRMHKSYAQTFSPSEIEQHATLAEQLDETHLVQVTAVPQPDKSWQVTIVGYDYPGELSMICGLFVMYGMDIQSGHVFTYEPSTSTRKPTLHPIQPKRWRRFDRSGHKTQRRPKIVDVFNVRELKPLPKDVWAQYAKSLDTLLHLMNDGKREQAQTLLIKQVADAVERAPQADLKLYPVDIQIDNEASLRYTVLRIQAPDTPGFLYELTNALSLNDVYIGRVEVEGHGQRIFDTLYVTDGKGQKITTPKEHQVLRTATVLVKHFTHLLPHAPNPASALLHFRQLLKQLMNQPEWMEELTSLEKPAVLDALARLLGVSDFLWDDFLRMQHANLFPVLKNIDALVHSKGKRQLTGELEAALQATGTLGKARIRALNAFKDREMFRIDMRHILGHIKDFTQFSLELTELAEVVVQEALTLCLTQAIEQYGRPTARTGEPCPLCVLALGKCGGQELGFASDIELMFVYAGNGRTPGPSSLSNAEFFEKVVQDFLQTIHARREGIFEVDLRLRPYGSAGSMAVSLEAFAHYFSPEGPAWDYERQALIRMRPIAGDLDFGRRISALRDEMVYTGQPFDVTAMRAMRQRQLRHLVSAGTFNAKYSPGGLVDVEYLVQGMQWMHGHRHHELRCENTLQALAALQRVGVLTPDEYEQLRQAYGFLRRLIDALRMVRGNEKDLTVPHEHSEEFAFLARRLGYGGNVQALQQELTQHTQVAANLNRKLLG